MCGVVSCMITLEVTVANGQIYYSCGYVCLCVAEADTPLWKTPSMCGGRVYELEFVVIVDAEAGRLLDLRPGCGFDPGSSSLRFRFGTFSRPRANICQQLLDLLTFDRILDNLYPGGFALSFEVLLQVSLEVIAAIGIMVTPSAALGPGIQVNAFKFIR